MDQKNTPEYVDSAPVVIWFRFDLRLQDHAGIVAALATGKEIFPIYIWDETLGTRALGSASKWWLAQSLKALDKSLRVHGSRLIIAKGDASIVLTAILHETKAKTVICSHSFDPELEKFDAALKVDLESNGIAFERYNTTLLALPNLIKTKDGQPFRVFTPFYRALVNAGFCEDFSFPAEPGKVWRAPKNWPKSLTVDELGLEPALTPSGHDWAAGFDRFTPGEAGAHRQLSHFLDHGLHDYAEAHDRPDLDVTSHLSPHLRFGEISPQRILAEAARAAKADARLVVSVDKFRSELAWREFSYGLLDQQPLLHEVNFKRDFDDFPWREDDKGFRAWRRGETGYPLVDAGMRELWQTGYMHNRVRMLVASFLTKHLLIDWRRGEAWFWDCLLDADPANNTASWQWVAGCGADAAPYFRIFNPISQADKFDSKGDYRRRYIHGYTDLSDSKIHSKSQADLFDLAENMPKKLAEVHPYPQPIVDHAFARERALEAYQNRHHKDKT